MGSCSSYGILCAVRWALLLAAVVGVPILFGTFHRSVILFFIFLAMLSRIPDWGYGQISRPQILLDAAALGFLVAWVNSDFVSAGFAQHGWVLRAGACALFAAQAVCIGFCLRSTRRLTFWNAVLLTTVGATLADAAQLHWGVAWPIMSLVMASADTPIAQWSSLLGTLGVSAVLHFACFLWLVDPVQAGWKCVCGPLTSVALLGVLWIGGVLIESRVVISPPPLSALLVQPGIVTETQVAHFRAQVVLDDLTTVALAQEPVDLVVWPEGAVLPSSLPSKQFAAADSAAESQGNLVEVLYKFQFKYKAAGLVGVPLSRTRSVTRYGLQIDERRLYNSALLIQRDGGTQVHDKMELVPMKEGLPDWAECNWVRHDVLPWFGASAPFTRGEASRPLALPCRSGNKVQIAACICYESLFPQLPQYHSENCNDVLIHLLYDGAFTGHSEWIERHLLACRMRAIETRKWQFVCSTCSGTCMIDPRGRVVARLPAGEGVLRTDRAIAVFAMAPQMHKSNGW